MFEVGFSELLMLGLVTLLVVGPEQLPKVARTAGLWVGRARRMIAAAQANIERELRAEEMKDLLHKQKLGNRLEELIEEGQNTMNTARRSSNSPTNSATNTQVDVLPTKDHPPAPPMA